ncbi:MAG TPA: hypothetical protein C5S37_12880 [Methanophagales archaeon]|nr:hypothetical protein [Methanophagales archaeon]
MSESVSAGKVEIEGLVTSSAEEVKGFLKEGEELLKKGEVVQASETIYKAAEDTVKILAKTHAPDIYGEAESRGRWTASLLDKAVRSLERKLGEDVGRGWDAAWVLHVEGFHEESLDEEAFKWRLRHVLRLVNILKQV